ncbi:hypothetical protein V2J09_015012 [Rumex salicifolius]
MRQPKQQLPAEATARPPLPSPQQRPPVLLSLPQQTRTDSWPQPRYQSDESPRSPLRSESHLRSEEMGKPSSPSSKGGGAVVAAEDYFSPLQSPLPNTPPKDAETPENSLHSHSHTINLNRAVREENLPSAIVLGSGGGDRGMYGGRRRSKKGVVEQVVNKSKKEVLLVRAALILRVLEVILCLLSFSVMATDKTEGWSGDSFCLSINVIGFVYAAFQACELAYNMATAKHALAYLLMSASSASASRIDDWQTNWGKDAFTVKASASVTLSFFAFAGFAISSLISGYNFCNRDLS